MDPKNKSIVSISKEERKEIWDDTYAKEEGIVLEFNLNSHMGKVRSLQDGDSIK